MKYCQKRSLKKFLPEEKEMKCCENEEFELIKNTSQSLKILMEV